MSDATNVNAVVVMGLAPATKAVLEEWEAMGAPLPRGYAESTRASMKGWPDNGASTQEVYRLAVHFIGEAQLEEARRVSHEKESRRRAVRHAAKAEMTTEMRAIREESLGLSQAEMDVRLQLRPGTINNAENPRTSYANDRIETLLAQYRVEAKLAGISGAQTAKSRPKQSAMVATS